MEEEDEKYRQISQQEAKDIDANKVSYYTLLDGTVVFVKKDGEAGEGSPVQGNEPIKKEEQEILSQNKSNNVQDQAQSQNEQNIDQNKDINTSESNQINQQQNTLSIQEMQDQAQIQTQSQNQQILSGSENENVQLNTEINTDTTNVIPSQNQSKNNNVILQPGDNFAYSSIRIQKPPQNPQEQVCPSCNYRFPLQNGPGQFVSFNAKLIEARPYGFNGQLYKVQNLQNYSQSQTQLLPKRRQLYKLIEAVPIKVSGMNLVNINTNTKLNLVNSNSYTYLVEKNNTNNNRSTFNSNQYKTYTQTQKRTTQRVPYNTFTQTKSNTRINRAYEPRFDYPDQFMEDDYNQYTQLKDTLTNYQQLASVSEMEFRNELKGMEQEMSEMRQHREVMSVVALTSLGFLLALAILLYLVYRKNGELTRSNQSLYQKNVEMLRAEEEERRMRRQLQDKEQLLSRIQEVMENTDEIFSPEFSLERLAMLSDSKSKYVSQVINEYYEQNFNNFLNSFRIKEACKRMGDLDNYGNYTIEAISESVGFKSRSTFVTSFKRITGLTPSQYQRMARKEAQQ